MDIWQYKIILGNARRVEYQLNELAYNDWEPVGFGATAFNCACLVRKPKNIPASAKRTGFESKFDAPEDSS